MLNFVFSKSSYYRPGSVIVESELLINIVEYTPDIQNMVDTLVEAFVANTTDLSEFHLNTNSVKAKRKNTVLYVFIIWTAS